MLLSSDSGWEQEESFIEKVVGTELGALQAGFLELRQEPGVYSRVTAGMSIRKSSLFIEVRDLSRYEGQLRNVN